MLAAIREHLATSAPFDAVHDAHEALHEEKPREISATVLESGSAALLERFRESLEIVGGHSVLVSDEVQAAKVAQGIIEKLKARRVAFSNSPLVQRVVNRIETEVEWFENASSSELFGCDLGITSAQWAIAETGTLVLEADEERHRLASLVPPAHIAIIEASKVRQTLGEALQLVGEAGRDGMSRTITFITGPSRTSDIELTLAIGVHGPGELSVIIVENQNGE
jgi:L-lactate utilization protein LutC